MKKHGNHTWKSLILAGLLLPSMLVLTHCKLTDDSPKAVVMPENNATEVPVNAVIEIQYPKDLGVSEGQMKKSLFSIRECEKSTFSYFNPAPAEPAAAPAKSDATTTSDANKNTTASSTPEDKTQTAATDSQTKYKADIKFFHSYTKDKDGNIFNYLVVNPENRASPFKANTSYCVTTRKVKNDKGEMIGQNETSFTTEESESFTFDTRVNVAFAGNRLAASVKNKDGTWDRDYVLVNFLGQGINPNQLQNKVKTCLSDPVGSTTEACKNFGKDVTADVFLVEGLKKDADTGITTSSYNLYAVSPHAKLEKDQKYKIVVYLDLEKTEDVNMGSEETEVDVDDSTDLNWINAYKNDVVDEDNKPAYSPIAQLFFISSGS